MPRIVDGDEAEAVRNGYGALGLEGNPDGPQRWRTLGGGTRYTDVEIAVAALAQEVGEELLHESCGGGSSGRGRVSDGENRAVVWYTFKLHCTRYTRHCVRTYELFGGVDECGVLTLHDSERTDSKRREIHLRLDLGLSVRVEHGLRLRLAVGVGAEVAARELLREERGLFCRFFVVVGRRRQVSFSALQEFRGATKASVPGARAEVFAQATARLAACARGVPEVSDMVKSQQRVGINKRGQTTLQCGRRRAGRKVEERKSGRGTTNAPRQRDLQRDVLLFLLALGPLLAPQGQRVALREHARALELANGTSGMSTHTASKRRGVVVFVAREGVARVLVLRVDVEATVKEETARAVNVLVAVDIVTQQKAATRRNEERGNRRNGSIRVTCCWGLDRP
ncbi:hypothetical protein B0H17DRAFT_1142500 [Mycena rosella]|uniref:Uncharacterized protein n=1 Tax=Mycena rosella TaxID=1033263 RepID=A0AAD7CX09_MYCRO|nr:hypothetical protein B0H17DRAFT_1142500 [Mycena rosella]